MAEVGFFGRWSISGRGGGISPWVFFTLSNILDLDNRVVLEVGSSLMKYVAELTSDSEATVACCSS